MDTCVKCGHELAGRFCTNCGYPATADEPTGMTEPVSERTAVMPPVQSDWRTDTAERAAVPGGRAGSVPAPPAFPPSDDGPRFPLFADEVPATHEPRHEPAHETDEPSHQRRTIGWVPWAGIAAVLLLILVGAVWLIGGGAGGGSTDAGGQAGDTAGGGKGTDVARLAAVQVPATAPPNQDVSGNMVRYDGRNMLDGVPQTCWRMIGDGTGKEITLTLAKSTRLTSVGMINGYAKTAHEGPKALDWYHGNRRVLTVEWTFDDGKTVTQDLADTNRMQTVKVGPVTTRTVRLKLVSVSEPGRGPAARNNTAISDVSLVGAPA